MQKPWNAKRFEQKSNRYEFAFAGERVQTLRFGHGLQITLSDAFSTQIDLWMPFTFTQHGQSQICDLREPGKLAPLLPLIGCQVVRAWAAHESALRLEFDNGAEIEAPARQSDYQWEAWQITDSYGFQVVCSIGGRLSIWMPDGAQSKRRETKSE